MFVNRYLCQQTKGSISTTVNSPMNHGGYKLSFKGLNCMWANCMIPKRVDVSIYCLDGLYTSRFIIHRLFQSSIQINDNYLQTC